MKKLLFILFLALQSFLILESQTTLRITTTHFNKVRSFNILTGEPFVYKCKGDRSFKKDRISAMQDSSIVLENKGEIKLSQLKAIRLNKNVHLVLTVQTVFFAGAVAFVSLNTINNEIIGTHPVFDPNALYVSGGLLVAGMLVRELGLKRIRVNKHTDLKILSLDFQHLGTDSISTSDK